MCSERLRKARAVWGLAYIARFELPSRDELRRKTITASSQYRQDPEEIKRLLARTSMIRNSCDLDLLVFLHRHPRTLLTNEQIAAFVGHDMKLVAEALDAFIAAGFVERLHNPTHAAPMNLLVVHGPQGKGLKELLELASTRQGRRLILEILNSNRSHTEGFARRLRLMKGACA